VAPRKALKKAPHGAFYAQSSVRRSSPGSFTMWQHRNDYTPARAIPVTYGTDTVAFIIYVLVTSAEPMRIVS